MWTWVAAYGGSSSFLILVIGVPAVYYLLAYDAHKDFSDTLADMMKNNLLTDSGMLEEYENGGRDLLQVFELEWWVLIAFAILVSSVLISGYVLPSSSLAGAAALSQQCKIEKARAGECIDLKSAMALYAAMIGLLVAFRLAWIRLALLRYTSKFRAERAVSKLSDSVLAIASSPKRKT